MAKINVNHVEIPILNLEKAKEFYKSIFDWDMDIEVMPNYGLVDRTEAVSLGFPVTDKIPESGLGVVFGVENIDATLESIVKNGGKIHSPKAQITPEIGYSAEFIDCFGNKLSLFSPPEK